MCVNSEMIVTLNHAKCWVAHLVSPCKAASLKPQQCSGGSLEGQSAEFFDLKLLIASMPLSSPPLLGYGVK